MNPYATAKIYRIDSQAGGVCYIGSTIRSLQKRMGQHKGHWISHLNGKSNFISSFNVLEHGDAVISLVEDYPCDSKDQLAAREAHHIRTTAACVNRAIPGRSTAEWYQDNRERQLAQANQYRADNLAECMERVRQYNRTHREEINRKGSVPYTCQCGATVKTRNVHTHRQSKKHKDKVAAA